MQIKTFVFNPFYENTYVVYDEDRKGGVIDPGCYEDDEKAILDDFIEKENIEVQAVLNTHCHIDHVLGNDHVKSKYAVPLWIPELEREPLRSVEAYAPSWGITGYHPCEPDHTYRHDETVRIGSIPLRALFTPGHSPGHMVLYHQQSDSLLGGDVLFHLSIGRTDLPGADHETLIRSIREVVFSLPSATKVYPGHGQPTTLKFEKDNNPFLKS